MTSKSVPWILLALLTGAVILFLIVDPSPSTPSADRAPRGHTSETRLQYERQLSADTLDRSVQLAKEYLLRSQTEDGDFHYRIDLETGRVVGEDHPVREAGALWGLALAHHHQPSERLSTAIRRGVDHFRRRSKRLSPERALILHPTEDEGKTGTVALVSLALIDWLRTAESVPQRAVYEKTLERYLNFLLSLTIEPGHVHSTYSLRDGSGRDGPSPYFDGETLLALTKAAKYMGYDHLKPFLLRAADRLYRDYVQAALDQERDSDTTKGAYQWLSMAYYELYTADWDGTDPYARRTIELAYWMIDVHDTLDRTKNTAYAHEGLAVAWELARRTDNALAMHKIGGVLDRGLRKLSSWQVGSPLQNSYLRAVDAAAGAEGGVMNSRANPILRIDVTQHQLHALLLARRFLYDGSSTRTAPSLPQPKVRDALRYAASRLGLHGSAPAPAGAREVTLFLSAGNRSGPATVARGRGPLDTALDEAIATLQGTDPEWLKLDVVNQVWPTTIRDVGHPVYDVLGDRSLAGLAFDEALTTAVLPGELVAQNLVDGDQDFREEHFEDPVAARVHTVPGLDPLLDIEAPVEAAAAYRFTTASAIHDGEAVRDVFRTHRTYDPARLNPEQLMEAARAAGRYLARAVGDRGRFVRYEYRPSEHLIEDTYNILRHAGTTYALLQLGGVTGDTTFVDAGRRALRYLSRQARPCGPAPEHRCIVEDREVKLGGNGLALVAFAKYTRVTGDRQFLPLMRQLAGWIVSTQDERGRFTRHKITYPGEEDTGFRSDYYPGEAVLGLARLHRIDGKERWLSSAQAAARYLITVRDRGVPVEELDHDHWLLYGLSALHRIEPDSLFLAHSRRLVDAILRAQNTRPRYPDWHGSYYRPPRSTPTATRTEGLTAAYRIVDDPKRRSRIVRAARRGVAFQLAHQFRAASAMYLDHPALVLGAVHGSLDDPTIRIDYVQHSLSALLGLRRILQAEPQSDSSTSGRQ